MKSPNMQTLVIYGTGLSAWLSAAVLKHTLPDNWMITLIDDGADSNNAEAFPLADTLGPDLPAWSSVLAPTPASVIRTTGSFSWGTAISGLNNDNSDYFQPYSSLGIALGPVHFHKLAHRMRADGAALKLGNFSMATLAAQARRFLIPEMGPQSPLSTCRWGAHIDTQQFTAFYQQLALNQGLMHIKDRIASLQRKDDGMLSTIVTEQGRYISADLFIDCSAQKRLLQQDNYAWESWNELFPFRRSVFAELPVKEAPEPYSTFIVHDRGWIRHIPLPGRSVVQHSYADDEMNFEEAAKTISDTFSGCRVSEEIQHNFGCLTSPWQGNCIAVGGAAALVDPIGVSNLHLLFNSINLLLAFFPSHLPATMMESEYNRRWTEQIQCARDYAAAHYKLNMSKGKCWETCRDMAIPDSLQYKIELYTKLGKLASYDGEVISEDLWVNLFDEQGLSCELANSQADTLDKKAIEAHLSKIRNAMLDTVNKLPSHAEFLQTIAKQLQSAQQQSN